MSHDEPEIFILSIDHRHGTDARVFHTSASATQALASWCRQWWPTEHARWPDQMSPEEFDRLTDDHAISLYFDNMTGIEWYSLHSASLED